MRQRSVSLPRSSNRTGGFPASGFPIGFTMEHTDKKIGCKRVLRSIFPVLHSLIQQPPTGPVVDGVARLIANHRDLPILGSTPKVRVLSSAGITRPQRSYEPVRRPSSRHLDCGVRGGEPRSIGPPPITRVALPACCAHYPGGSERVRLSGFLPRSVLPSPLPSRVGIRIATFEACSSFTRYGPLARSAAQAAFVTGLQSAP